MLEILEFILSYGCKCLLETGETFLLGQIPLGAAGRTVCVDKLLFCIDWLGKHECTHVDYNQLGDPIAYTI